MCITKRHPVERCLFVCVAGDGRIELPTADLEAAVLPLN